MQSVPSGICGHHFVSDVSFDEIVHLLRKVEKREVIDQLKALRSLRLRSLIEFVYHTERDHEIIPKRGDLLPFASPLVPRLHLSF